MVLVGTSLFLSAQKIESEIWLRESRKKDAGERVWN